MAGLASLTQSMTSSLNVGRVGFNIITLDETGKPIAHQSLQYFPESLQDSKSVSYATRSVPGGSLPIYQWVSGGPRRITLKAVFTRDMNPETDANPVLGATDTLPATRYKNVDIRAAIVWLRSHIYPRYTTSTISTDQGNVSVPTTMGPRQVILNIPNSGIGVFSSNLTKDSILAYMMECGVEYVSFFPNGIPRIVHVSLAFEETAQYNGVVSFPATSNKVDSLWTDDYPTVGTETTKFFNYAGSSTGIKSYILRKNMPPDANGIFRGE